MLQHNSSLFSKPKAVLNISVNCLHSPHSSTTQFCWWSPLPHSEVNGFFEHALKIHHAHTNSHSFHTCIQQMTCKSMEWKPTSRQPRVMLLVSIHKSYLCHKTSNGNQRRNLKNAKGEKAATGTHCLWIGSHMWWQTSRKVREHTIQQLFHSERNTLQ